VVAYLNRRSPSTRSVEPVLKYGQQAPAIDPAKWLNQDGETAPPDLSGKVVLIEFWGISCGPCVAQLPEVRAAAKHFASSDLVLIGLHGNRTTVERLTSFAKENQLAYQLAIDREATESGWFGATMQAFGVRGIPSAAVINRQGRLVYLGDFRQALKRVDGLLKAN
jgi:peroxiredoxin